MDTWTKQIKPEDLPGELMAFALEIGVEAAIKLADRFGGGTFYLPQAESVISNAKKRFILDNPKMSIRDLRMETGYSDRQILRIKKDAEEKDTSQQTLI